ncbi:rRNA-processing protein efg1 [Carex littledalei]|uniref:rRNA-processing protein EFG1 n=1 Tax=Carex littledalei TaxID=544730 RepID=A0A833RFE3_9POAL|nr:rRNA-processing protein efg1 [Carex littledalei]
MAHGGYARRRLEERRPVKARRAKGLGPDKRGKKVKSVSIKNQIRSTERYLRKELPNEVREAQQKKLEELKKQLEIQNRLVVEREIQLRDRKIKFFERRKIERMIRRLEKQLRTSSDHATEAQISSQLSKLKEDLEYVRFFPKNEKYVSLFAGGEDPDTVDKRNKWRKQIKVNSMEAAASGKELEETGSDDDALDISDDDFFMSASSSDDEADDEWTDKSTKEPASSASGKAASGMSSDEKNERQRSARVLMPPPRSLPPSRARSSEKRALSTSDTNSSSSDPSTSKKTWRPQSHVHSGGDNSNISSNSHVHSGGDNSNISSNSDTQKPRRKRKHRKKKKQAVPGSDGGSDQIHVKKPGIIREKR